MELKNRWGDLIFALEGAKTIYEVIKAARAAGKSLSRANLYGANLSGANLSGADLSGANLSGANLSGANLSGADLSGADLSGADLSGADLSGADLYGANLYGADLSGADLSGADLSGADLSGADLSGANLSGANLSGADLSGANLSRADLSRADLSGADLSGAENNELALAMIQFIPETGPFVGWKKCRDGAIVRLSILHDAKRSHGASRKCRCSKAKVLSIYDKDGKKIDSATSLHDGSFVYRKGEVVTPANGFDDDRWVVCGAGIHFFLTRKEAEAFVY